MHVVPAYLTKPITLRLQCRACQRERLHHCLAVGIANGRQQRVETVCLHCEKRTTK